VLGLLARAIGKATIVNAGPCLDVRFDLDAPCRRARRRVGEHSREHTSMEARRNSRGL